MKNVKKHSIFSALLVAVFAFQGCGTTGTDTFDFSNTALDFDFRVTSTSPQNGSNSINASTNTMQIFFSEDVDPATIPNNIIVKKDVNATAVNITPVSITPTGSMIDIQLESGNLSENTIYYVIFMPGLKSINNNFLYDSQYAQGVQVAFNTGTGYGNSVSGPPVVQSIESYSNFNGCFSALVRFNEDVSLNLNDITMGSWGFLGIGGFSTINSYSYPFYQNRNNVWVVEADCNITGVSGLLEDIKVTVHDAVDIEGNHLAAPYSRTF